MNTVTLSSKYQVVIPKEVRKKLGLEAGHKFHVLEYEGRIELIPFRNLKELRGFAKGISTTVDRDRDRL